MILLAVDCYVFLRDYSVCIVAVMLSLANATERGGCSCQVDLTSLFWMHNEWHLIFNKVCCQ